MKVGDYVRTKYGSIYKIDEIGEYSGNVYATDDTIIQGIIKSSPNIIDLIEEEDYVNGYKVLNVLDFNDNSKMLSLEKIYDSKITNEDIKSIVTKEQFESMEYKVKE